MQQELIHHKEVDTLRVALLGFSIISIIVLFLIVVYITLQYAMTFEEFLPDTSEMSRALVNLFRILLTFVLLVPLIISFVIWVLTPSFVKYWYNLSFLPSEYMYIHDFVQEIASKMGILPPKILYTQKRVANCYNLGKTEHKSNIVISKWLADYLLPNELKATLTHEMAHIKNKDITLMTFFSAIKQSNFVFIPFFIFFILFRYLKYPVLLIFLGGLPFMCILMIFEIQWHSRLREGAADARASLFIDKKILKRTLYKLASARSMRMVFVSSSLIISGSFRNGVFSSHPTLNKRFHDLDREKYIIDIGNPLPLKFHFFNAVSIFVFTILLNFIFTGSDLFIVPLVNWNTVYSFLLPLIAGGILGFYSSYLSLKNISFIIIFLIGISSIFFLGLIIFAYIMYTTLFVPPLYISPGYAATMDATGIWQTVDWIDTIAFLLRQRILFGIYAFLVVVLLRIIKKYR
jgi:heat shock protein HtpX